MIDIHTHIIPDLDDGPPDMETSVGMGKIAASEGIETMISTSHSEEASAVGYQGMLERLDEVRAAWEAAGTRIRLELGVEIYLRPDTVDDLETGRLWTLAGSQYVLVELPYQPWPAYADQALFDLQLAGYIPILAHPERYTAIQSDPNRMRALAERGILGQVTSGALLGHHGPIARRASETLVRYNLVQIISSDSHGVTARKRLPQLRDALRAAAHLVGEKAAEEMATTNPTHILSRTQIVPDPRLVPRSRGFLGGLFGRRTHDD